MRTAKSHKSAGSPPWLVPLHGQVRTCLSMVILLAVMGGASASALAEECDDSARCQDGLQCSAGQCVAGQSKPSTFAAPADKLCGRDRRCRIDRLKRRNQARRRLAILAEEKALERQLAATERQRMEATPRRRSPIGIDILVSQWAGLGYAGGYTFFGRLRAEIARLSADDFIFGHDEATDRFINGQQYVDYWSGTILYFFGNTWFSPYLSTGFTYGSGQFYEFFDGTDTIPIDAEVQYHAVQIGGGIDVQRFFRYLRSGFHARIGIVYRHLLYNQARLEPGVYDQAIEQSLRSWFSGDPNLDLILLFGWSF
ncbi:MAG: hypothetical protein MJE77_01925 [Proteobacteria bacterium]|nr:hypothetical protein [Pseudomonadota bacterium]